MNYLALLLICILTFVGNARAQKVSKVKEFQSEILLMRVQEMLTYRKEGLAKCAAKDRRFESDFKYLGKGFFNTKQEKLEATLRVLVETENHPKCSNEIQEADEKLNKLQRKKFEIPVKTLQSLCALNSKCLSAVNKLIQELDPFCVTQNSKNYFGVKDGNACMAGDRLLAKVLRQKNDPTQLKIYEFLTAFQNKITSAREGSSLDLWKVYLETNRDTAQTRKEFLALMAFFYYTLGTAGGYVDGIGDHYWLSALKESQYPEEAFAEFYSMRQKVDWYGPLIHKEAKKKNLKFTFKHVSLEGMNRHDYMAMFLSCHFREYNSVAARMIPTILGLAYESLDFVSHIKEEVSLKDSAQNFKKDSSRYAVGSTLGNGFCAFKF
jgi:hypothetical protein